ncbi:hypothetical protein [Nocardia sp. NPDC057455]|uniref:hypothetical protein n=1 Tax=Nocardia sp. NPDC057455 TaxID=3346138 RepID=UPI00366DBC53
MNGLCDGPAGRLSPLDQDLPRMLFDDCHGADSVVAPSIEVPRAGANGPVMLSGREELDNLIAQYGSRIVFHGSRVPIRRLEPRQASWKDGAGGRFPDGEPAVCVDVDYDVPIFTALFKFRSSPHGIDIHADGTLTYKVKGAGTDDWRDYTGYVHVVNKQHFELVELEVPDGWPHPLVVPRTPEWRATSEVEPFAIVKVTVEDFPHPIIDYDP